jgi:hypothetical protein
MKAASRLPLGNQSIIHMDAAGTVLLCYGLGWSLWILGWGHCEGAVVRSMQKVQK